jgi:hypothetical protein
MGCLSQSAKLDVCRGCAAVLHQNCAGNLKLAMHIRCRERSFKKAAGSAEDAARDGECCTLDWHVLLDSQQLHLEIDGK